MASSLYLGPPRPRHLPRRDSHQSFSGQLVTGEFFSEDGKITPEKRSEADLKCSVCLDLYQDPLLLPCLHSYCQKCLEGIAVRKATKKIKGKLSKGVQSLTCPQCCVSHSLPEGGVSGFPSDQALANEVQAHALKTGVKSSSDIKPNQCTMCTEDDPAKSYCATCGKYLCDFCHKAHKRQVDFRSHKVTSLSELNPHDILAMEKPLHCRSHAGEVLKLYCKTCNRLICRDCTIVDHRSHEYGFNSDLRPVVQKEVSSTSTALKQKQENFEQHKTLVLMAEKEYEEYTTSLENDITATFNGYIKRMEARRDELLQKVQDSKQVNMKQIWAQKEFIETTLSGITSALQYANRLCGCTSNTVMLAMHSEATAHFDKLKASQWDTAKLQLSTPWIFQKNNPQIELSGQLNEISGGLVRISVIKKGSSLQSQAGQRQGLFGEPVYNYQHTMSCETIALGDKIVLTVQSNYTPCFSPPVSVIRNCSNYQLGGTQQAEFKSYTISYVKKGEWTLEILPTQSGLYIVSYSSKQQATPAPYGSQQLYSFQVSGPLMKVGSRVRRGPNWKSGDEDGGVGSEGTVLGTGLAASQPPQYQYQHQGGFYGVPLSGYPGNNFQVLVEWSKTCRTGVYVFNEQQQIFEIELISLG